MKGIYLGIYMVSETYMSKVYILETNISFIWKCINYAMSSEMKLDIMQIELAMIK